MNQNVLEKICATKAAHVTAQKSKVTLDELKERIANAETPRGFITSIENTQGPALIAEVKKASPSKGLIRENFDPAAIAKAYETAGASCISCLTDEPYFQGSDEIFTTVKQSVKLPLLRKDFMIDPYQIYESRALGADCILIIMAALNDDEVKKIFDLTNELGMDTLFEVHDREELDRALTFSPKLVGVNARNLKTLEVNLQTTRDLGEYMPSNIIKVAESGIGKPDTIQEFYAQSFKAFLVGESLMRQDDVEVATRKLLSHS